MMMRSINDDAQGEMTLPVQNIQELVTSLLYSR